MKQDPTDHVEGILYLECECHAAEHIVRFMPGWEDSTSLSIQLNQYYTLWDRIRSAIKYIFTGIGYVGWDTVMLKNRDIPGLIEYLQKRLPQTHPDLAQ